jgi:hypothetical protein
VSVLADLGAMACAMAITALLTLSRATDTLLPVSRWLLLTVVALTVVAIHPAIVNRVLGAAASVLRRAVPRLELSYSEVLLLLVRYLLAWWLACAAFALLGTAMLGRPPSADDLMMLVGSISIAWLLSWIAFFVPGGLGVREVLLATLLGLQFSALFGAAQALAYRLELLVLEAIAFVIALALRPRDATHADEAPPPERLPNR